MRGNQTFFCQQKTTDSIYLVHDNFLIGRVLYRCVKNLYRCFQNHAVTKQSCFSVSLLLPANSFNWWSNKAFARGLFCSGVFISAAAVLVLMMWPLSGLRCSVRLQLVCQKSLTPSGMKKYCAHHCPVKWRICTGGCGMHVKHGVKLPAFWKYLWSVFQPVSIYYPQTFCRLLLMFSGNFEGKRERYIKYIWLLKMILCSSGKGGGFSIFLTTIMIQAVGTGNLMLDFQTLWSSLCHSAGWVGSLSHSRSTIWEGFNFAGI